LWPVAAVGAADAHPSAEAGGRVRFGSGGSDVAVVAAMDPGSAEPKERGMTGSYQVERAVVDAVPTAVIAAPTTANDLARTIGRLIDPVRTFVRSSGVTAGHNIVFYEGDVQAGAGTTIEVGVVVDRRFAETSPTGVHCSELPAGKVARTVHLGHYHRIAEAHTAVRQWCADQGETLVGPSWEIYGDWTDDPRALESEVLYLLR
jgi:effector-binding domain-containing protein